MVFKLFYKFWFTSCMYMYKKDLILTYFGHGTLFAGHSSAALVTVGPCDFNDMQCCSHDALTIVGCSKY